MLLSEVVKALPGQLVSDGEFRCLAFATETEQTAFLTFLEREKFLPALENPNISCVLTTAELAEWIPAHIQGVFVCERPKASLFEIHNHLADREEYVGKPFPTKIGKNCQISPLAAIGKENVIIGDHVTIDPFVVIQGRVVIGDYVTIRAGTVIGAKGFSFSKDADRNPTPVIDAALVEIQDHVDIFNLVHVAAGVFPWERTVIGAYTKIAEQSHIGHGAHIGSRCMIANAKCCGNSRIGDNVWVGPGAVVSNRVRIGSGARVSIGAIATKDVSAGETVTGNFAIPHRTFMRNLKASLAESTDGEQLPPPRGHTDPS